MRYLLFLSIIVLTGGISAGQNLIGKDGDLSVTIVENTPAGKVDIMTGGKLFTTYQWPANIYKPVLYPVFTSSGTEVTRGFPVAPKEGERNDHIHQVGIWLNYGNVNGIDYWGTGYTGNREPDKGVILHKKIVKKKDGRGEAILVTRAGWTNPSGKEILAEESEYRFIARGSLRMIDRITTLTAVDTTVMMNDTKEGMFGFRVARELELPLKEKVTLIGKDGKPSPVKVSAAEGATGNYLNSEGVTGEAVWGKRAKWMELSGVKENHKVSVIICDHPKNPLFPTYWHARGYGLFAANPFGWNDFTSGKERLNYSIKKGEKITFRYRVIISSGEFLTPSEIEKLYFEFSGRY